MFDDVSDDLTRELLCGFVDQLRSGKPPKVIGMVMRSRVPAEYHARVFKEAGVAAVGPGGGGGGSPAPASPKKEKAKEKKNKAKKSKKKKKEKEAAKARTPTPTPTPSASSSDASSSESEDSEEEAKRKKKEKKKKKKQKEKRRKKKLEKELEREKALEAGGIAPACTVFDKPVEGKKAKPTVTIMNPSEWQPNADSGMCSVCDIWFTAFTRKHHCRMCGMLVCQKCSMNKTVLVKSKPKQRVCDPCNMEVERQVDLALDQAKDYTW